MADSYDSSVHTAHASHTEHPANAAHMAHPSHIANAAHTARKLAGKPVADAIYAHVTDEIARIADTPCLAIVSSGDDGASRAYERSLTKKGASLHIDVEHVHLPNNCTQDQVERIISRINNDVHISGCLILRPLSPTLDEEALCDVLSSEKDVDGISFVSLGSIFSGRGFGLAPCTAEACVRMLDFYHVPIEGAHVVVVGRSLTVGRPLSMMLLARNATVTMCHSKTVHAQDICKNADIVICAVGKAHAFGTSFFSPGQIVLDVGINFDDDGKICGDVAPDVDSIVSGYSPVPGGIGSVTTAVMMEHVVTLAKRHANAHPQA